MKVEVEHRVNNFPINNEVVAAKKLEAHLSETYFNSLLFGHQPKAVAKEVLKLLRSDERKPVILQGNPVSKIIFRIV